MPIVNFVCQYTVQLVFNSFLTLMINWANKIFANFTPKRFKEQKCAKFTCCYVLLRRIYQPMRQHLQFKLDCDWLNR